MNLRLLNLHSRILKEQAILIFNAGALQPLYYYNRNAAGESKANYGEIKNENEAKFVIYLCCKLIKHLQSYETNTNCSLNVEKRILIISPYRAQVYHIKELLKEKRVFGVDVFTVDGVQGKERDFIIFSCVRGGKNIGFLKDQRRLNVALTRARQGLYVVGHLSSIATKNSFWKKLVIDAEKRNIISNVQGVEPILPLCK